MNSKLTKVNPQIETAQYIKGSNSGNYFLISSETSKGIVAFRPLSVSVPTIGTSPKAGQQTRVRVVPANGGTSKLDTLMQRFGFGRVNGGSAPVHYSKVTGDPESAIADAKLALELAA